MSKSIIRSVSVKYLIISFALIFSAKTPVFANHEFSDSPSIKNLREIAVNPTLPADVRTATSNNVVSIAVHRFNALMGHGVLNSGGSGFVVEKNLVLAAAHEIMVEMGSAYFFDDANSKFYVLTENGNFPAKVEYADVCEDLVVLRVEGEGFNKEPVSFEAADLNAVPNDPWFAFGFPDSLYYMRVAKFDLLNGSRNFSFGGYCPSVEWGLIGETKPGYSGGPIFDSKGLVRGLITGAPDEHSLNSFFVPVSRMLKFLEDFKQFQLQQKEKEKVDSAGSPQEETQRGAQ